MTLDLTKIVRLEVPCSECGETDLQRLSELVANNSFACGYCGASIDVSSKEWRALINETAESLSHIRVISP